MRQASQNRQPARTLGLDYEHLERRDLLTTIMVNSFADDLTGVPDGFVTLREAVIAAETNTAYGDAAAGETDGDRIVFDAGLDGGTIFLLGGEFTISDDLEIDASNVDLTVNGSMLDRVFNINSAESVVLRGLTVSGGMNGADGGGALIAGMGSTTLDQMNFIGNTAMGDGGGAVASTDATLTISNSTFVQNLANGASGSGGALLINSGDVLVTDSTFTANVANRAGGAVEIVDGTLRILDSTLGGTMPADGNIAGPMGTAAPGNGGALHVTGMMDTFVAVRDSVVSNNVAASEGGGLWNQSGSTMLVKDSTISANVAMGDDASNGGGGIFNNGGITRVRGSVVDANLATGLSGSGGGLFSTDGLLSIVNSTISGNEANRAGGGIEVIDGELYVGMSTLSNNVAGPMGTASPGNGGALHVTGSSGTISNFVSATITGNFAASEGGGLWNQSGSSLFVRNSMIAQNEAAGADADNGGGGIFNNGGITRINNTFVDQNVATGVAGSGGGILSTDGIFSAYDSTISGNQANRAGGGIELIDGSVILVNATLGGSMESQGNVAGPVGTAAPGNGGGLHVSGMNDSLTLIIGGNVANNVAASEGGGLWNQSGSTLAVQNGTVIRDNHATGAAADNGGGGIFNNGGRLALVDAAIVANFANGASGSGGGIFSTDGLVTVQNSRIVSNVANRAGGGVEIVDGNFLMFNSILGGAGAGNIAGPDGSAAPGNGGGLHVTGTNGTYVAIDNSIVGYNTAANEGGGLWSQSGSTMDVRNSSIVSQNTAGDGGGGGLFNNGGILNVFATTVVNNSSTGNGGGVGAIDGSETRIEDSLVGFNSADFGGGFANDGQAFVRDSVFARNNADSDGGGIFTDANGITDLVGVDFFSNSPNDQA